MKCSECDKVMAAKPTKDGKGEKLPRGWKSLDKQPWCDACWKKMFVRRSFLVPLAVPRDDGGDEFQAAVKTCWEEATALANWSIRELAKTDVIRMPGDEKLGKHPGVNLYTVSTPIFRVMDPASRAEILSAVSRAYTARRYEAIWLRKSSLPSYRYPYPHPVRAEAWKIEGDKDAPVFACRIKGEWYRIPLLRGRRHARALKAVLACVEPELKGPAILDRIENQAPKEARDRDRPNGGAQRGYYTVGVRFALWIRRQVAKEASETLYLRTDPNSFWIYHVSDADPRYFHADHLKRWVSEHRNKLDRFAHDVKYEKRWPTKLRRRFVASQSPSNDKFHHRMNSFVHEATAMITNYAVRNKCSRVVYDDSAKTFVDSFRWDLTRIQLASKLDQVGITLEFAKSTPAEGAVE